jgi:hypothetical protein
MSHDGNRPKSFTSFTGCARLKTIRSSNLRHVIHWISLAEPSGTRHSSQTKEDIHQDVLHHSMRGILGPHPLVRRARGPHAAAHRPPPFGGNGGKPTYEPRARTSALVCTTRKMLNNTPQRGRLTATPKMDLGGSLDLQLPPPPSTNAHGNRRHDQGIAPPV